MTFEETAEMHRQLIVAARKVREAYVQPYDARRYPNSEIHQHWGALLTALQQGTQELARTLELWPIEGAL